MALKVPLSAGFDGGRRADLFYRRRFPTLDWILLDDGWPRRAVDGVVEATRCFLGSRRRTNNHASNDAIRPHCLPFQRSSFDQLHYHKRRGPMF